MMQDFMILNPLLLVMTGKKFSCKIPPKITICLINATYAQKPSEVKQCKKNSRQFEIKGCNICKLQLLLRNKKSRFMTFE